MRKTAICTTRPGPKSRNRNPVLSLLNVMGIVAFLAVLPISESIAADDSPRADSNRHGRVTRIEEDWSIVIGTPNEREHAPQIVTVISPTSHLRDVCAIFELNHSTLPDYLPGGMQLQLWKRGSAIGQRSFPRSGVLAIPDEKIDFTSVMRVDDRSLTFEVINGNSKTWGRFGGQSYLEHTRRTRLKDLSDYRPEASVRHSFVGYASHRVRTMVLREVRYYFSDELVRRDTNPRVVHEHQPE